MANLQLKHIYKVYPNGVKAVNDFTMDIDDKEFIVFVGPSGCGKSTTLRMIAGLEEISAGELYIGEKMVNNIEPKDRDIAMVFQNYALYPHMTVYGNMAFGLKLRKAPLKLRDENKITVKKANGKKLGFFDILLKRTRQEARDENGRIVTDAQGNVIYAVKTNKKGKEKRDRAGNPVYKMRPYNIDEYAGPVVTDENGVPVFVAKKDKNGNDKRDKNGDIVYKKVKLTKYEIQQKVEEAARVLDIMQYLDRKPKAMSGGQRQRVALGRAIVREPKVFLLDEPLSNLDAKLRTAMRSEISKLHKKLQTTFVYVTHDQVEAMTMGTRIVVMKDGFVQQIDTPRNIYSYPVNKFVAGFIGTPQMNFFRGRLKAEGDDIIVTIDDTDARFAVPYRYFVKADASYFTGEKPVILGIRSEHVSVDPDKYPFKAKCRVFYVEDLGMDSQVYANLNLDDGEGFMNALAKIIIKAPAATEIQTDGVIEVSLDFSNIHIFDAQTEKTIVPRIPERTVTTAAVRGNAMTLFGTEIRLPSAIALSDGRYEVVIPTFALTPDGNIRGEYAGEENINGSRLVEYLVEGRSVFVTAKDGDEVSKGFSVDLKYCTFLKEGKVVKESMPQKNSITAQLCRIKKTDDDGNGKKVTRKAYLLRIGETEIECADELANRLIAAGGDDVLKHELTVVLGADDVNECGNGIPAVIECVEDYGTEKFAVCRLGGFTLRMSVDEGYDKKETRLSLNLQKSGFIDHTQEICLI